MLFSQWGWPSLAAAAILAVYVGICYSLTRRSAAPRAWWLPLGFILSATYVYGMQVSGSVAYGGIAGDASYQIAYLNNVIHGNYLGDAYTKVVPADYSLLYFWILGTIARLAGLEATAAWRLAPAVLLLATPYIVHRIGSNLKDQETGFWCCVAFFGLGAFQMQWFIDPYRRWGTYALVITKPHEVLAALLLFYWCLRLSRATGETGIRAPSILASGIVGALLVMAYYPVFVFGVTAIAIFGLLERDPAGRRHLLAHAGSFGLLGMALSSPNWFPFVSALATHAHEPMYRSYYLELSHFDPTLYTFGLGYFGGLFCLGALALKDFVGDKAIRLLLILVATCYTVILSTFVLYPLAGLSFLPNKWSELLMVAFGLLAGRGLQLVVGWLPRKPSRLLVYVTLLLFIPSPLLWNRFTDNELSPAASDRDLVAVARAIVGACEPSGGDQALTVLATPSVAYAIPDVSQWRLYLAPHFHFSSPLAQYKLHADQVRRLGRIDAPGEIDQAVREMGIDVLVLGKGASALLLEVDQAARPSSLIGDDGLSDQFRVVRIRPRLFSARYFAKVYEDEQYVALAAISSDQNTPATEGCRPPSADSP